MKTIVVYTSKYGSTARYAKWIAEALGCTAKRLQDVRPQDLEAYDAIIYGGSMYVGSIAGFQKFLKMLGGAKNKKLGLFMVGMTNPAEKDIYEKIAAQNIPADWQNNIEVFTLRGDQLFSKMSGIHKLMMRMPKAMAEKKAPEERTEEDRHFIENFGRDVIFTSREQIDPIVAYFREAK